MPITLSTAVSVILAGALLLTAAPHAARAQSRDTLTGSVVRVRTVRMDERGAAVPRGTSAGEGLLIRRRGVRQRVDVLQTMDDSIGRDWITGIDSVNALSIHEATSRRILQMKFDDLRQVFSSLLQVRFDSATAEAELLGDGPVLLGHRTRRVRIVRGFRMQTARAGKAQVLRTHTETDALIAPDVPDSYGSNSVLSLTSGSASAMVEQIFGPGSSRIAVRGGGTLPTGLALRTVSRTRMQSSGDPVFPVGAGGGTSVTVDSVEVLSIGSTPIPDSIFASPADYAVVDFGTELRKLVTLIDELGAAVGGKGAKPTKALPLTAKPIRKPSKP
jgi:hypothetical protein